MRLSYNERAVSEGRFRHHLFQAVFVRTSYPSRYVYFRWSRVHKAVETAVTATVVMWERCKSRVQLEASEIGEIQAPVTHERRLLWRPDLHQVKDLFLYFLKILTWWGWNPHQIGAISPWNWACFVVLVCMGNFVQSYLQKFSRFSRSNASSRIRTVNDWWPPKLFANRLRRRVYQHGFPGLSTSKTRVLCHLNTTR